MYNELKGKIISKFGSQKSFAIALGKDDAYVSGRLNGRYGFSKEDILAWSDLLDIDKSEIGYIFF